MQHKDGNEQESESCLCIQMSMLTPGDLVVSQLIFPHLAADMWRRSQTGFASQKLMRTVASERFFDCKHALCQVKH